MDTIEYRRRQLLNDTLCYYSVFPRCIAYNEEESYVYARLSGDNTSFETDGDVIGRLLDPAYRNFLDEDETPLEDLWESLPSEITSLGRRFITELCCLHDNCDFWNGKGLSPFGEEFVEEIKDKFCKGT